MFEKFGELDSYEQLNELAGNLKAEGDTDSIRALAKENGLDEVVAEAFIEDDMPFLCDPMMAALGKIEIEAEKLKPKEIMTDWIEYLKSQCFEEDEMALAVRRKGKSLTGMIAEILKWSFNNQIPVDKAILDAAKVKAGRVTLGIPGMEQAKKLIRGYYLGGAQ